MYGDEFYFDDGFDSDMYWDSYDPFANIDPSSLDRAPPIDSVNTTSVLLSPTVQVLRSDNVFLPQDRHRINGIERTKSPDVLELDVAMFIVPTRKAFHEGLNLCPSVVDLSRNRPVMFTQLGWDGWKVKKDWQVKVKNCKLEVFDTKQCVSAAKLPRNSYRRYCADFMPPMNVLHYETDFPINGRWDFDQFKRNPAVVNVPEYTIDMQTSYFFTHDENIGNVDRSFAASMMGAVEVNQGGQLVGSFPGSSLARSTGLLILLLFFLLSHLLASLICTLHPIYLY